LAALLRKGTAKAELGAIAGANEYYREGSDSGDEETQD
jgi:hypothetical protein